MENKMTQYEAQLLPKQKVTRKLIEEIYSSPAPPARPNPVKLKPSRYVQLPPFKLELRKKLQLSWDVDSFVCISGYTIHTKSQTGLCAVLFCCFLVYPWKQRFCFNGFLRHTVLVEVCSWISHRFYFTSRWILFLESLFMAGVVFQN